MIGIYKLKVALLVLTVLCLLGPSSVHAYLGPGAGLSAIGSLLALIAAIAAAIFGFLWFPLKRLFRKSSKTDQTAKEKTKSDQ